MKQEETVLQSFDFLNLAEGIKVEALQFSPVFIVSNEEKIIFYFSMVLKENQIITFYFTTVDLKNRGKVIGTKKQIADGFNEKVKRYLK